MSALYRIVYATHANGTHHKLALDALEAMRRADKEAWERVFLKHVARYLEGSKAPDNTFKDFKNHVLHVADNYWGGAPEKAEEWYRTTVDHLRAENWEDAVYAAGVLSHYYTDPVMPFHTGQTEAENAIHRATEWTINRSYDALRADGERRFKDLDAPMPAGPKWLSAYVCDGAEFSHRYYEKLIAHYDIHKGSVRPEDGLDEIGRGIVAELLIYAANGFGHVLDRAITEAGVSAPEVTLTAETFLAMTQIPRKFIEKRLANAEDKKLVAAIYDELKRTGTVDKALPEENRVVRDLYQAEVLAPKIAKRQAARAARLPEGPVVQTATPVAAAPAAVKPSSLTAALSTLDEPRDNTALELPVAKLAVPAAPVVAPPAPGPALPAVPHVRTPHPRGIPARRADADVSDTAPRRHLMPSDDLEAAPSIGPVTAARFAAIGVHTVGDFLSSDPDDLAQRLDDAHFDAETLAEWQDQAQLVIDVPGLRGTHAQLLVGAGYRTAQAVADADPISLSASVLKFVGTSQGKRVLREGRPPDLEKVKAWVDVAKTAVAMAA